MKYYITTTLPYVNAEPHLGFALEIIQADALARWQRFLGQEVIFNTGTDEHGQKIYQVAVSQGKDPKEYCDEYAAKFSDLKKALNLSYTHFIRTTDEHHLKAAQVFWQKCLEAGDIYKKNYQVKYCVGCELEKTDSELVDGLCPLHTNRPIEIIEEENYFFRWSNYQDKLLAFYEQHPDFVVPEKRFNEIKAFVKNGLQDFSISRLKSKMPWGVAVPGDENQVMYVWFDALVNYISTLSWPDETGEFKDYWPGVQVAGKDNLRQQSAMWQAMLMSAGVVPSKQIFIHGFIVGKGGVKMSKSLGNVISPIEYSEKYGTDALRYFILSALHPFEDSEASAERFYDVFQADLANGLGNLISRVTNLIEKNLPEFILTHEHVNKSELLKQLTEKISQAMIDYRFDLALSIIMDEVKSSNQLIDQTKPWDLVKTDLSKATEVLSDLAMRIGVISETLAPFLPETAEKIQKIILDRKIVKAEPLFPRLDN